MSVSLRPLIVSNLLMLLTRPAGAMASAGLRHESRHPRGVAWPGQTPEEATAPAVPPVAPLGETWLWLIVGIAIALAVGLVAHWLLFAALERLRRRAPSAALGAMVARLRAPSRVGLPLLAAQFVVGSAQVDSRLVVAIRQGLAVALIATVTWGAVRIIRVVQDVVLSRHRVDVADNLQARRMHTQLRVLSGTASAVVAILGLAAALMTFPQVRQVGTSLLASAGIAGLVAGVAARPVLENLIAGVQLAFTEPIRIDDVVVIEGHWSRVEEVTLTYIVVRIWDERRLVVPLTYFITKPVENWTRRTAQVLGTVLVYADYTVPVARLREELGRIVAGSKWWDGRAWALQVTDATPETVQLRAVVSAADGPAAWELRCEVRERLIGFLQRDCQGSLPRLRAEIDRLPGSDSPGP